MKQLKFSHWTPGKWSKICSSHFSPDDFDVIATSNGNGTIKKCLKPTAVPFYSEKEKIKEEKKKNAKVKRFIAHFIGNIVAEKCLKKMIQKCIEEHKFHVPYKSVEGDDTGLITYPLHILNHELEFSYLNVSHEVVIDEIREEVTQNSAPIVVTKSNLSDTCTLKAFNFCIESIKSDDKLVHFYTGLETYQKFQFVFQTLGEAVNELSYINGPGPSNNMSSENQFLLTLLILRQNRTYYEILVSAMVRNFTVAITRSSKIFHT
ncbi:uncharacterized protein LOC111642929 [Copidosoma floridanum]|uniref:uncharacterized protein LOC111642929 n=1 Tax=Copidosoma floridanum TaxID=29053 RepID=UPI000C6FB912|nr:uncharacterized protein LOC111642929 [Copidosoma floridanum]